MSNALTYLYFTSNKNKIYA